MKTNDLEPRMVWMPERVWHVNGVRGGILAADLKASSDKVKAGDYVEMGQAGIGMALPLVGRLDSRDNGTRVYFETNAASHLVVDRLAAQRLVEASS